MPVQHPGSLLDAAPRGSWSASACGPEGHQGHARPRQRRADCQRLRQRRRRVTKGNAGRRGRAADAADSGPSPGARSGIRTGDPMTGCSPAQIVSTSQPGFSVRQPVAQPVTDLVRGRDETHKTHGNLLISASSQPVTREHPSVTEALVKSGARDRPLAGGARAPCGVVISAAAWHGSLRRVRLAAAWARQPDG